MDTTARGVVKVGPARLRRADPFGLVLRVGRVGGTATVWVRPNTVPLDVLPSPRSREPDGPRSDGASGAVLFNALREYLPGDDLRFVHWPSSARAGMLLVREQIDPSEPTATVLLDTRRRAYPNGPAGTAAFEEAVDIAASVVLAFAERRYPVRLVTTGGLSMHNRRRRSGAGRLLDALADVGPDHHVTTSDRIAMDMDIAMNGGGATGRRAVEAGRVVADGRATTTTGSRTAADVRAAVRGDASLGVLATLPRGGVGTLTLVTGRVEVGQIAGVSPVAHRFEQVVVVRVGEHRYRSRPTLRRLAPVPLSDSDIEMVSLADIQPVAVLGDDEAAVRLAGRLHVVTVSSVRNLPDRWPARGRHTKRTAGMAGAP